MDYKRLFKTLHNKQSRSNETVLSDEDYIANYAYVRPRLKFGYLKTHREFSNMMDKIDTINKTEIINHSKTNKTIQPKENTQGVCEGWVYCLSNQSYKGVYKIGFTTRTPNERAQELSRETSIIYPFVVEVSKKVKNCRLKENQLHKLLNEYRVRPNKEFFDVSLEKIKNLFDLVE